MFSFKNFFTKSEPQKNTPTLNAFAFGGFSALYEINFDAYFRLYENNPYIASAIDRIRSDVGAFGFEIYNWEKISEKEMKIFENLVALTLDYTPRQFIKRLIRDYEITGNAFVYLIRENNKVIGLQILDPRYVKPIINTGGQILGYYQNLSGIKIFTKDEMFHLKSDNDLNFEALGRSKMRSLFVDLETDNEARESNLAFFKNNQTPSSLVVLDPNFTLPDGDDELKFRKQIKDLLESGKYTGGKNHHRSAVIEWIKEVIKLQDKITDAEFLNLRKFSLELVCSVYGVNKDILGFTDTSNRSVGENQSMNYYTLIEEKENLLDEFMTKIIKQIFGENFSYKSIKDTIRLLSARSSVTTNLYNNGIITLNEARKIVGYDERSDGDFTKIQNSSSITPQSSV